MAVWLISTGNASAQSPTNDSFDTRGNLSGNSPSAIGSNVNATAEAGEPFAAAGRNSVWWSWTAPSSGTAVIRTFNSKFDTVLAAYTGSSVSSLSLVASNDDDATTLQSRLEIPVTKGVQYQIQVSSHDGQSGPISLSIAYVNTAAPDSISLSKGWMDETASTGVTVATLGSTDPDAGDVAVFSLVPGEGSADNGSFTVAGNQLRTRLSVLYDEKRTVSIRLRATDRGGLSYEQSFIIVVVPEVPHAEFVKKSVTFTQQPNYVNSIFQLIGKENGKAINYPKEFFVPGSEDYRPELFRAFEAATVAQNATPISLQESYMQVSKFAEVPAKVRTILLLDTTRSLALDDLAAIKEAAKGMVDLMFDEQEIAVYSFSGSVNLVADFTGNKPQNKAALKAAIDTITRSNSNTTNLYGGIAEMLGLSEWKESFSLTGIETGFLVVLTDGEDTSGSASMADVIGLRDDDDPNDSFVGTRSIYTVGLGASIDEAVLTEIGNAGYYLVEQASSLAERFVEIQRDIIDQANSYYWVNYSSPKRRSNPPGQLRKLELRLLNNTNTEPDGVLSSTFLSDTFTDLDSALYVNRRADMPAGVSVLEIPRDTISTASAFTIYPPLDFSAYTWTIGNPLLAEIVETSEIGERVLIKPSGRNGTTTLTVTDLISDTVGDFTKQITLVIGTGVNPSTQTINFAALPDKSPSSLPFTLSATSSSGLPVSFRIVSGPATLTGNTVTLTGGTGVVTVSASQAGNESNYAAPEVTRTFNVALDPLAGFLTAAGIPADKQGPLDDPDRDGVSNILEYAFNSNPALPAGARPMAAGGLSGMPRITASPTGTPPGFQMEYLRRKGAGLLYTPEVSNDLKNFSPMPGTPAVSSINAEWERVNLTESSPPTAARRFARVRVSSTVNPGAPAITIPPLASQLHTGKTATLRVEAAGSGLSYQWYRGNVGDTSSPVGTNSPSYTTPPLTATTPYWVRITNASGRTDSQAVNVTVTQPAIGPVITHQPRFSNLVPTEASIDLTVVASGTAPLTYQWYQGAEGDTSRPVGTNSPELTTPGLTSNTIFWVRVSNPAGYSDSSEASITIIASDMALVPQGSFAMGGTSGDSDLNAPQVSVTVSPFYIGKNEVTYEQWTEIRDWAFSRGYEDLADGGGKSHNHPVHTVTWWDAVKWCNARSEKEGLTPCYRVNGAIMRNGTTAPTVNWSANGYRLPTEAEWEKAARGGVSGKRFPWGTDTISHSLANFWNGGTESYRSGTTGFHSTYATGIPPYSAPVGSFPANAYGLHDMSGNLGEWCWDWYASNSYVNGVKDPRGPATGLARLVRGGSWDDRAMFCRVADRNRQLGPEMSNSRTGFRVVSGYGLEPPVIVSQPQSAKIKTGETATLEVVVTGSGPISYQWSRVFAGDLVGADSPTFTTPPLTSNETYRVRVVTPAGTVDSDWAWISVITPPIILFQPSSSTISSGEPVSFRVVASSLEPMSYQWYRGPVGITTNPVGTDSDFLYLTGVTSNASYWVRISNSVGSTNSLAATVSVKPSITTQPSSIKIASGQTASLSVTASGPGPLSYQWYQGSSGTTTTPVGGNAPTFTTPALSADTSYWVRVSNSAGIADSTPSTVSIKPSITTQPNSAVVSNGQVANLSVTASGPAPLAYQWFQGLAGVTTTPVGTNSSSFTTPVLTANTNYWVRVSNPSGSTDSTACLISVKPAITTQPSSSVVGSGQTGTLSVTASGPGPLSYQWYQGAVGITTMPVGTNSAGFTTPALAANTTYWVRVSNAAGSADSDPVTISVKPTVTALQFNSSGTSGDSATVSVTAAGPGPLSYQWYQGTAGTTTTPVGTNASTFSTPPLTGTANYWVRVSNSAGSADSATATITVRPGITTQPASASIISETQATLAVTATGTAPLIYQWYQGPVGTTTIPVGTNSASFATPALTTATSYWVRVSNSVGSVDSSAATIQIKPRIAAQPPSSTVNSGQSANLSVTASGPGVLSYEWYQGPVGATNMPVGSDSASFATPALTATTSYWVRVSNSSGSTDSALATITVRTPPSITSQPTSRTIISGQTATLTVSASGTAPLTYQWYQGTAGTTTTPVGTNSSSYTTPALSATMSYWVRVSNSAGSADSILATVTVNTPPSITSQPASATIASGSAATLTVTATGSAPLTYQWYRGPVGTVTTPVGTNAASLTTPAMTATATYWVRVSNTAGSVNSSLATVSMAVAPVITTQPASPAIASGNTATLTVSATGTAPMTYQWYQGAVGTTTAPVGANSASFTSPALTVTTTYWVRVSNTAGSVNSSIATVSMAVAPVITTQPASPTIASGNTATLTVSATGTAPMTYQWYQGAVGTTTAPVGTNSASFTSPALTVTTTYWVRVTNLAGSMNSSLATVSMAVAPSITTQPVATTIASGNTATLTVTATGTAPLTYQWYQGAVGATTTPVGTNSSSFTSPALTTTVSYWVRVSNLVGNLDSSVAVVKIGVMPVITSQPRSITVDHAGTATLTVAATGSAPLSYQWYEGAVGTTTNPVGVNSASFVTPNLYRTTTYWVRVGNAVGSLDSALATVTTRRPPVIPLGGTGVGK